MLEQQVMLQIRNDKRWWWPAGGKHQRGQKANASNFILVQLVQFYSRSACLHACTRVSFFEKDKAN